MNEDGGVLGRETVRSAGRTNVSFMAREIDLWVTTLDQEYVVFAGVFFCGFHGGIMEGKK